MENNIPKSWATSKICDIFDIIKEPGEIGKVPYLEIGNVNILEKNYEYTDKPSVKGCKVALRNDVIVSRVRPTRGAITKIIDAKIEVSSAFTIIRNNYKLADKYLFYFLAWNKDFYNYLGMNCTGTLYPSVSEHFIINYLLPVAPINEQVRIVNKLDTFNILLSEIKKRIDKIPLLLKRFHQSVLSHALSGKLTEEWRRKNKDFNANHFLLDIKSDRETKYLKELSLYKKKRSKKPTKDYEIEYKPNKKINTWATAKLENLIYIAGRIGWRGLKADEYTDEGPLFLSVYNLNYGDNVDYKDAYRISKERYIESPEIQLQNNDILLCKDGAGIGKIGIIDNLPEPATINSSLLLIRSREAFNPKFLFFLLKGPELQNLAKQRISGSATPHLFQKDIKEFKLDIPPLEEQDEIVNRIEKLFKLASNIEAHFKNAKIHIDNLHYSVFQKAFQGELITQNDNDEPADELLKRIREEKELFKLETKLIGKKKKERKMKTVFVPKTIIDILKEKKSKVEAKTLWKLSVHKDNIDDFYAEIKRLIEEGKIIEIDREGKKSFIKLI